MGFISRILTVDYHTQLLTKLLSSVYKCLQKYNRTVFGGYLVLKGSASPRLLTRDIHQKQSDNIL